MIITIDRFEGDFAVAEAEDGKLYDIPRALFPGAKEGESFEIKKCENPRENRIKKLMNEVFE